jgi:guanylate kinase
MTRHRVLAVTGPSFVGKSTFIRYCIGTGLFAPARLRASRAPRPAGDPPQLEFVSQEAIRALAGSDDWLVSQVGQNLYALDLRHCRQVLETSHLVLEVAPDALAAHRRVLPQLYAVMLWPDDFDLLQAALSVSVERLAMENAERVELNQRLKAAPPATDLRLTVKKTPDPAESCTEMLTHILETPGFSR